MAGVASEPAAVIAVVVAATKFITLPLRLVRRRPRRGCCRLSRRQASEGPARAMVDHAQVNLRIKLKDQSGKMMTFVVESNAPMREVFDAYSERTGLNGLSLRFLLDGERVTPEQTPATLDLCDGDQIDCVRVQVGGKKTRSQKRGFSQSSHDSDKRQRGSHASEGSDAEPSEGERVKTKKLRPICNVESVRSCGESCPSLNVLLRCFIH